jgi:heme/copper-type cytochrome/quinol oxidase subunit 4
MSTDQDHQPDTPARLSAGEGMAPTERVIIPGANAVRRILVVVIALLIFREIVSCLSILLGAVPAVLSGITVFAIQLFCSRMAKANRRFYFYMLLPTLIFTVVPIVLTIRRILGSQVNMPTSMLWATGPALISFVLPVILLLIAYWILSRQNPHHTNKIRCIAHSQADAQGKPTDGWFSHLQTTEQSGYTL